MKINELYEIFSSCNGVSTDSRNVKNGALFFALRGENFDGNRFATAALASGAKFAVVDDENLEKNEKLIFVKNSLETLRELAAFHRKKLGTKIVAITGTNGKTTTKELVAAVLKEKFRTHFTQGNLNNHIGVPLTLLDLRAEHEIAIVEMGANHPGEIADSAELTAPNFGLITNVGKAHLLGFGSFEGVRKTKGELFDFLRKTGGKIFINSSDENLVKISNNLEKINYSTQDETADVFGKIVKCEPFLEFSWKAKNGKENFVKTSLIGTYNINNLLAAVCVGKYFGVEDEKICAALENYSPKNNRSQLLKTLRNTLIIDTYNANPTSMEAAIRNFQQTPFEKKVLLIGDMLELGELSNAEHKRILEIVSEGNYEKVFLIGEEFFRQETSFKKFKDINEFLNSGEAQMLKNCTILIKASHGIKLEKAIEKL